MSTQKTGFLEIPGMRGILSVQEDGSNLKIGSQTASASGLALAAGTPGAVMPAGTATVAPLTLTSGTNLTTAAAGALEFDGAAFYATAVASSRQVIPVEQFVRLTADYTLTDVNTAQKAFNATANGALTLAASTAYYVQGRYIITNTGTTSHTWAILLGGAATITAAGTLLVATGYTATSNALTSASTIYITGASVSSATVMTAASTSATENVVITFDGTVNINAGGTLIPQVQMSAAAVGTEKMLAGSYFLVSPLGASTVASLGNWS